MKILDPNLSRRVLRHTLVRLLAQVKDDFWNNDGEFIDQINGTPHSPFFVHYREILDFPSSQEVCRVLSIWTYYRYSWKQGFNGLPQFTLTKNVLETDKCHVLYNVFSERCEQHSLIFDTYSVEQLISWTEGILEKFLKQRGEVTVC